MLQMLQRFFALATHKGKFETEEDFADTIVPCYDWMHDGHSLLRLRTLCMGFGRAAPFAMVMYL